MKKIIKELFKSLFLIVLPVFFSFSQEPGNLINNPGFENISGNNPVYWTTTVPEHAGSCKLGIDETEYHSGKHSFKISRIWIFPRKQASLKTEKPATIDPRKNYLLSFWYKTKDIDEYPEPFSATYTVACDTTPSVQYGKLIYNSDEWQPYYLLMDNIPADGKEVSFSFNTMVNTRGSIWIDDVEFREASKEDIRHYEQWRRQNVTRPIGDATGKTFAATGFYRVEKAEDRWWLVDPSGNPTWAMSIDGTKRPAQALGRVDYSSDWFVSRFGSTPEAVTEKMYTIYTDICGFNSFAGWTGDEFAQVSKSRYEAGQPYMPMTRVLGLATATREPEVFAMDRDGNRLDGGHAVPDPFNPKWRKMARLRAEKAIIPYRDAPWFLGWFVDNEMSFAELYRYIWAEFSSKEFIRTLEEKYKNIDLLNRAWSSSFRAYRYTSFNDILNDKPEPIDWDDPLWTDFATFERYMLKTYIDFTYDLVRELDPNHLIISNRINLDPMPEAYRTIDLWSRYDIVCINIYPDNNKIGFNQGEIEIMKKLYEGTGRPVMIGEWSVPAIDSGLYEFGVDSLGRPLDWSWPQVVRTQKERGEVYNTCIRQLASLDFMVGAGWFITFDANTRQRRANRGIMTTNYELYKDLTDIMKESNAAVKKELGITW
ncbi:MAG: beta-galactosidase [Prolixibacteraceae bacterium]|jgi:hypothetical protein|nr:beta-galactosidase [Prolixibacteraceae bacterium]